MVLITGFVCIIRNTALRIMFGLAGQIRSVMDGLGLSCLRRNLPSCILVFTIDEELKVYAGLVALKWKPEFLPGRAQDFGEFSEILRLAWHKVAGFPGFMGKRCTSRSGVKCTSSPPCRTSAWGRRWCPPGSLQDRQR